MKNALLYQKPILTTARLSCGLAFVFLLVAGVKAGSLGEFESAVDVGKIEIKGSADFVADQGQYRVTGSGANIWAKEDAFQFLHKKVAGDLALGADVGWVGQGKVAHRKACWMVRQGLEADDVYADVAVHGDGLISLQYRPVKGGQTLEIAAPIKGVAKVLLERDGDVFSLSISRQGGPFQPVGSVSVPMKDPVYAGLAVCSHEVKTPETAIFSNVTFKNRVPKEGEKRVRETSLETISIETFERKRMFRERKSFEAPNWSPDGKLFYVNREWAMATMPVTGGGFTPLDTGDIKGCNNDHGLSFDGKWLAISAVANVKKSRIYVLPATGGTPRLVTPEGPSYWHGWSPDGQTLAFCGLRGTNYDIYTIPAAGGEEKRLTTAEGLDDGPEYTPDGSKIYFHSERTGAYQIWRMNPDGSQQEQVTADPNFNDWFPHPSPDGKWLVFISFGQGVKGHPPNENVTLRLLPLAGGKPKVIATLFGGQGTINVPSWSPDSKHIAFVSYRYVLP